MTAIQMSFSLSKRIQKTQNHVLETSALFISDPLDILYLTGFLCLTPEEREAYALITKTSAHLFLSSFSTPTQVDGLQVHLGGIERVLREQLPLICQTAAIETVQIDGNSLRFNEYQFLRSILPKEIELSPTKEPPLTTQRMVKDEVEIEAISKANLITHSALNTIFTQLRIGMTELDVQQMLEKEMRNFGVQEFAFPTIVCFGNHTALPHHQPGNRELTQNTAVLIDCGAKWQKYCADVTRTSWFGNNPDPEFTKIEEIVKIAYKKTLATLDTRSQGVRSTQSGSPQFARSSRSEMSDLDSVSAISAAQLDQTARDFITEAGFGPQFIHTTGHGVGLYIHEQPSLNQRNLTELKPGMIITIEPGIYLENTFGYRFENSILVTKDSCKELL